jgi:peptidoglycan/LPS O-acetylase OafA/YrhL
MDAAQAESQLTEQRTALRAWPVFGYLPHDKSGMLYRYLPALDGLRAISILWVLSVHWPMRLSLRNTGFVERGALGVELFFAISGFLVTRSLHQCVVRAERANAGRSAIFGDFIVRRIARIWPPFYLALVGAFAAVFVDPGFRSNLPTLLPIAWSFPTFLSNYTIPTHGAPVSLFITWSLCFEEQFYIVLIAMYLLGAKQLGKYIVVAALTSIASRVAVANLYPDKMSEYIMQMETHYRFDAIAWGCLAWLYHEPIARFWRETSLRRALEVLVLAAVVLVCWANPQDMRLRALWYVALAPVFTALVCALCFSPKFWLSRLLAWAPLVLVGTVSYEIYLSHVTVFRVLSRLGFERVTWVYYPLSLAVAIGVGWLFHRIYSRPTQRWVRGVFERRTRPEPT